MKFKNIYKIAGLLLLALVLQSKRNGPAGVLNLQVTGAPGSTGSAGTCSNTGCHANSAFATTLTIELLDSGTPVTKYKAGQTYKVKITNANASGTPARWGVQAVVLKSDDKQAGEWGPAPTGFQIVTLNNRSYIEHNTPAQSNIFEFDWVAPAAGTGSVTIYSASVAANNNNGSSGDGVAIANLPVDEEPSSNVSQIEKTIAKMEVLPNPVWDDLNLEIVSHKAGKFHLRFADVTGAIVKEADINLLTGTNRISLRVEDLAPGVFVIQLCGDGHLAATRMLKR
jgi:hypothetical protein